jgi:GntR family transcriptional regulator, transcriptional repressor for pyruvate dehydrogenase complex
MNSRATLFKVLGQEVAIYRKIVDEIEEMVVSGQLKPGDQLPSERQLAERFKVSRPAVREAIKVLSEKQLVTVYWGKGVVVNHPSLVTFRAPLDLLVKLGKTSLPQLIEVRLMIEPEIAALAALRATPKQIEGIGKTVEALRLVTRDPKLDRQRARHDLAFHRALSEAAQNEVAKAMLDSVQEVFFEGIYASSAVIGIAERALRHHTEIHQAIARRDRETARKVMTEHLDRLAHDLLILYGKAKKSPNRRR